MISINKGKALSHRTQHEFDALAHEAFVNLTADEQKAVMAILSEMEGGEETLLELVHQSHWARPPVSMKQFLEDPYYMGIPGESIYPRIKEELIRLFDDENYVEVILAGSIGWGKSMTASFIVARVLYEMSCLRDPARSFGLSPGSEIHFALISKTLDQTNKVLKAKIMEPLRLSPYFNECFPWDEKATEVKFPNNIVLFVASVGSETRILGSNLFGVAMDEVNFMGSVSREKTKASSSKGMAGLDVADRLYRKLVRRIKSRFQTAGTLPGKVILISSKTVKNSFTERRVAESRFDPSVFVFDFATWDVKPKSQFTTATFRVLVGGSTARSRLLDADEEVSQEFLDETNSYIINVPEEYREDFESDLSEALRDIAGVSVEAIRQFITRQEKIFDAEDKSRKHPFSTYEWVYGTPASFMWPKICVQRSRTLSGGYEERFWVPRVRPKAHRHVHVDVALSGDSLGIAMGHIVRHKSVIRRDPMGERYSDVAPEIYVDFMLRVIPPTGEQIFLPDIRAMIYSLIEHGFQVGSFSCDSYQSAEMLQQMKARGIASEVLSVDRTIEPYNELKQAFYEERLSTYPYKPFTEECLSLEFDGHKGKVDHPLAGSKDVADSVAGLISGLMKFAGKAPLPMLSGYSDDVADFDHAWVLGDKKKPVEPGSGPNPGMPLPFLGG